LEPSEAAAPPRQRASTKLAELNARLAELESASERHAAELERIADQAVRAERRADELELELERIRSIEDSVGQSAQAVQRLTKNGSADLNSLDYDGLRALGLSITESTKVLAVREIRGGFERPEELDELDELTPENVAVLKAHLAT
jgi:DNA uptake protein ComE-like DNA-binding protein